MDILFSHSVQTHSLRLIGHNFMQGKTLKKKKKSVLEIKVTQAADAQGKRLRADFNVYTIHKNPTMIRAMYIF